MGGGGDGMGWVSTLLANKICLLTQEQVGQVKSRLYLIFFAFLSSKFD